MNQENIQPTPRKICPILSKTETQMLAGPDGSPPGAKLFPIQCIGSECQFWVHDDRGMEYGNCSFPMTAIVSALVANGTETTADNIIALGQIMAALAKANGVEIKSPPEQPKA